MTLKEFNSFDKIKQFQKVADEGSYISDRMLGGYRIALYKFNTFYVELYYHVEQNSLKKLKALKIEELSAAHPTLN